MGLFDLKKPRGFHHEYIYADKRKERLNDIEDRARAELGMNESNQAEYSGQHERIRGLFFDATKHVRRRRERKLAGGFILSYGVIIVLLILLIAIWKMLITM